eukprot:TRINITY_DN36065_c0_g1_i1.p1 TRINITY_DN36065_c0_g1~~TRINITY_DN36065_c0_g1_i1.p1  ORF type:complete len:627 (+),score=98.49 TRINITY_DN36065_c0_g1_i1:45-1925(+)
MSVPADWTRWWSCVRRNQSDLRGRVACFLATHQVAKDTLREALNVFDVLAKAYCHNRLCAAGALLPAYGDSFHEQDQLNTSSLLGRRKDVAFAFGQRIEQLAFLFHAYHGREEILKGDVNVLLSSDACRDGLLLKPSDIHDLLVMEAARLLSLGNDLVCVPHLAAKWHEQQRAGTMQAAVEKRPVVKFKAVDFAARFLRNISRITRGCVRNASSKYVVRVKCRGRDALLSLPVNTKSIESWLASLPTDVDGLALSELGFVLKGEEKSGMSAAPLFMLNLFRGRRCTGFVFEGEQLLPLEIDVVPLRPSALQTSLLSNPVFPVLPVEALFGSEKNASAVLQLGEILRQQGWAVVSVGEDTSSSIGKAYDGLRSFIESGGESYKRSCRLQFDGDRFVGYGFDEGREWMQLRQGVEDGKRFAWPDDGMPEGRAVRAAMINAFAKTDAVARVLWAAVCESLCLSKSASNCLDDPAEKFGASVMRVFIYKDMPSEARDQGSSSCGPHADMGLLTVSPPSTQPSLELLHPRTGVTVTPEDGLRPHEWLVFPGESLAFLSNGAIAAPLHRVPWIERLSGQLRRCSAPFFLRAAPNAELVPLGGGEPMTCRNLMERHVNNLRPWRLSHCGRGDF